MAENEYPKLVFDAPFDERSQYEARDRGWVGTACVQTADGATYRVTFYDTVRLAQDLEYEVESGRMCIAEPGLIVLPEVTLENMETAIRSLAEDGYFDNLRPVPE